MRQHDRSILPPKPTSRPLENGPAKSCEELEILDEQQTEPGQRRHLEVYEGVYLTVELIS